MIKKSVLKVIPENYRVHTFYLFGKEIQIGAMSGLHYSKIKNGTIAYLRHVGCSVIIGLNDNEKYTCISRKAAEKNGIEYYHIPVEDFSESIIPSETFDEIFDLVKRAAMDGNQVTIHCGIGDGRTGTALAALKLRELLESRALNDPSILDESPEATETVQASDNPYACTPLVKEAIEAIREQRIGGFSEDSGKKSVETENDVNSLVAYELHLRRLIKAENEANALVVKIGLWRVQGRFSVREMESVDLSVKEKNDFSFVSNRNLC